MTSHQPNLCNELSVFKNICCVLEFNLILEYNMSTRRCMEKIECLFTLNKIMDHILAEIRVSKNYNLPYSVLVKRLQFIAYVIKSQHFNLMTFMMFTSEYSFCNL